jgi:ABC-2 type transport system permease protein
MSQPDGQTGVIHDIGYQRYDGPRLGRRYAARSLYVHGVRAAFGIGRGGWAKVLPMGITAAAAVTALILVVVSSQLPEPVLDYVGVASVFTYATTIFVAVVAPELVSTDLRTNLLSLYLSRPLRRRDYALTKLAALASATFVVLAVPMLIMFVGLALQTDGGIGGVFSELWGLVAGLIAAAVHAALIATIALPLASLSGRRVFATGLIIAVFLLAAPVAGAVRSMGDGAISDLGGVIDPVTLLAGVDKWVFGESLELIDVGSYGPVYGLVTVVLIALGTAGLLRRYRRVQS